MTTNDEPKKPLRAEARDLVQTLLEHSPATGDELREVMRLFDQLDEAHKGRQASWDGTREEYLAAGEHLRKCDEAFWTALVRLVPMTTAQVQAVIEGKPPTKLERPPR